VYAERCIKKSCGFPLVGIVTRLLAGQLESWGSNPSKGQEIFLFSITSRLTLGPTQPPTQLVPGTVCLGGKAAGA
jgi:hypothetical protein